MNNEDVQLLGSKEDSNYFKLEYNSPDARIVTDHLDMIKLKVNDREFPVKIVKQYSRHNKFYILLRKLK